MQAVSACCHHCCGHDGQSLVACMLCWMKSSTTLLILLLIAGGSHAFHRAMSLKPYCPALPTPQSGLGSMAATDNVFVQVGSCYLHLHSFFLVVKFQLQVKPYSICGVVYISIHLRYMPLFNTLYQFQTLFREVTTQPAGCMHARQ